MSENEGNGKKERCLAEKLLLPVALVIGILFDRLVTTQLSDFEMVFGIFWLCYLVIFYAFYWRKLRGNKVLWFVSACAAALVILNIIFQYQAINSSYRVLNVLVIPCVLMAHAQFMAGGYKLKEVLNPAIAWFMGWFIKPFTGLPALFGSIGSLVSRGNKKAVMRVVVGVVVALLLLCVIVPLLCSADRVFGYYFEEMFANWNVGSLIGHIILVMAVFALFYSFLWNVGFGTPESVSIPESVKMDTVISGIVLSAVILVYLLFCGIEFTYLFAGAGLPDQLTYAEYAHQGFGQTVAVCAINLVLFGAVLRFGGRNNILRTLSAVLLALTAVILVSGWVRLGLYIGAYGLTWLRLLSAWFVIYLAAVILLCVWRMLWEKLPVVAVCAILLLTWWVALGCVNPDGLVGVYNHSYGYDRIEERLQLQPWL